MAESVMTRSIGRVSAFALIVGLAAAPQAAWAASEVGIGGYHDQVIAAAQQDLLGLAVSGPDHRVDVGGIRISVEAGDATAITGFTPRFAGIRRTEPLVDPAGGGAPMRRAVRVGPEADRELAGFDVGWSAIAEIENGATGWSAGESAFMLGGELAVSGVRLDAAVGEDPGLLGLEGSQMRAGVGYDFGGIDTRVSYGLVEENTATEPAGLLTLGSEITLRPWLVVKGDVAIADDPSGGDARTAGRVGLRLSF